MVEVLDENLALPDIPPLHYSLPWPPSLLCQPRPHQLTLPVEAEEEAEAGASGLTKGRQQREHTLRWSCCRGLRPKPACYCLLLLLTFA